MLPAVERERLAREEHKRSDCQIAFFYSLVGQCIVEKVIYTVKIKTTTN
jgi:hypothetical protein